MRTQQRTASHCGPFPVAQLHFTTNWKSFVFVTSAGRTCAGVCLCLVGSGEDLRLRLESVRRRLVPGALSQDGDVPAHASSRRPAQQSALGSQRCVHVQHLKQCAHRRVFTISLQNQAEQNDLKK